MSFVPPASLSVEAEVSIRGERSRAGLATGKNLSAISRRLDKLILGSYFKTP